MITSEHRAFLNAAAITDRVIDESGIQSRTTQPTGIVFFWRSREGVELPQLRPDEPSIDANGRPIKYVFPPESDLIVNKLRDVDDGGPVLIVEGTKQQYSALSYAPEHFAIYGISGCWGWVDTKTDKVNWVPDLTWAFGRDIYLLFDADLETNYQVWRAAEEFTRQAKRSGVKTVKYVQTTARGKNGLDDVLGAMPDDRRTTFLALWIEQAIGRLPKKPSRPKPSQFFGDNGAFLVRKATEKVLEDSPAALTAEREVALYVDGAYRLDPSAFISKVVDLLGDDYRSTWRTTIEEVATGLLYQRGLILPDVPTSNLVNVRNGMLDLATMTLKPHDPSYMSVAQLPIEWDGRASADTYVRWLDLVIPDQWEDLEEVASTMLDPTRTPSKAMFAFGPSRSGKSTFVRIMQAVAGVENRSAVTLHQLSDDRFAAANVYGRILNAASDLSARHVDDLSIFKMMTGEDAITGNRKYGNQFTFTNRALFAFSANELPTVGEVSRAYLERIKPFDFGRSFAGREDPKIEEIMMTELPGIFVRWVQAWQRMDSRGGYQVTLPRVRKAFEIGSSRVLQWIEDEMKIIPMGGAGSFTVAEDGGMTPVELHRAFSRWAEVNKTSIMGRKTFTSHLTSINGVVEIRIGAARLRGYNVTKRTEQDIEGGQVGQFQNTVGHFKQDGSEDEGSTKGLYMVNSGSETALTARPPERVGTTVFDLETADVKELFRRPDFFRLGGWVNGSAPFLTTDGRQIREQLDHSALVSGHNLTGFDLVVMAHHYGLDLRTYLDRVYDTDLRIRLLDPPESGKDGISIRPKGYYGLDQTCARFGVTGKTDDLGRLSRKYGGHDQIPTDDPEYRRYLEGDLEASSRLIEVFPPLDRYAKREMNVGLMTAQMTVNGFRVDVPELTTALAEQAMRKGRNFQELSEITGMPLGRTKHYKRKADVIEPYANPLASNEGKEAIMNALRKEGVGDKHLPRTDKGAYSVSGEQMKELRERVVRYGGSNRLVRILDLVCELVAERTVYQTADDRRIDDRVHPNIRPYQASGRWSVTDPGLTVFGKHGGRHVERRIFIAEEGHRILTVDLAQVDARAVAAHSGDEGYLAIFRDPTRDLHEEVAQAVYGKVTPELREYAKKIGHGWNYGEGVNRIVAQHGVSRDLAVQFDQGMRSRFPRLVEWQQEVRSIASAGDLLDNGFGRKMRAHPQFAYTQAPALMGQGCTRDILAEGLLRLPIEFWPFLRVLVHDELVMSVPEKGYDEISRIVVAAMSFDLAEVTDGRLASVPITAGVGKSGRNWAEVYEKG